MTAFASLTSQPLRNDTDANPRWVACTKDFGRAPSQSEFGQWSLRRWDDYFEAVGLGQLRGMARATACRSHGRAFEKWLEGR